MRFLLEAAEMLVDLRDDLLQRRRGRRRRLGCQRRRGKECG
jgi:hypothetical protein